MAILYVAKDGNDANSGATWALAKLTMGGAHSAASANDTIYVAAGRYSETVTMSKTIRWIAVGEVINDNSVGGLNYGFDLFNTFSSFVGPFIADGFVVDGWTKYRTLYPIRLVGCIARNNGRWGIGEITYGGWALDRCVCYNNGSSGIVAGGYYNCEIKNCVSFDNGGFGMEFDYQTNLGPVNNNVCFGNALGQVKYENNTVIRVNCHDFNHYDKAGTTNIGKIGATNYTTLAAFQAALINGGESHSTTGAVELNDVAKDLFHTLPSSTQLLGTGIGGANKGLSVAYGMSENLNLAKITGGVFSDVEWDAVNKRLQLVAPATSGYWRSDVIDLGCVRAFFGVGNIYATMAPPTDVVDYDVAEADPRTWTYRYRIDNAIFDKADVAPAWVEAIIMNPLVGITGRYVQVELTLRTDGV